MQTVALNHVLVLYVCMVDGRCLTEVAMETNCSRCSCQEICLITWACHAQCTAEQWTGMLTNVQQLLASNYGRPME